MLRIITLNHCPVNLKCHPLKALLHKACTAYFSACRFEFKIEHKNIQRDNEKTPLCNPPPDQQLTRVVSKCSVWW